MVNPGCVRKLGSIESCVSVCNSTQLFIIQVKA